MNPLSIKKLITVACLSAISAVVSGAVDRPNVLFIAIDDLRPELGAYGSEIAISPNLDKLASQGLLFNRAYCQQAICGPSRASIMTGVRPGTNGVFENSVNMREQNPDIVTLSQHFIANGYEAVQVGKIYHNLSHSDPGFSWSRDPAKIDLRKPFNPYARPENRQIWKDNNKRLEAKYGKGIARTGLVQGPAYEFADVPDTAYRDGYNTDVAIATMKEMANNDKPFFLGLGYYKPHLDFVAPKKYWDMYDADCIPLAEVTEGPAGGAEMGLHASFELRVRDGIPESGDLDLELSRTLKHAYLACVSYIDAQIGRMLEALESEGLRENTIIVVWGDHGWHLGDMGVWGKATNYEIATRVPLMIWTPDMPAGSRGKTTDALVELIDLYPTLSELADLSMLEHLEGRSFTPLLDNPNQIWKQAAYSQFPTPALREWAARPLASSMRETFFGPLIEEVEDRIIKQQGSTWDRDLFENHLMGYAMRTARYRCVIWKDLRSLNAAPVSVELYDLEGSAIETVNIANENPAIVSRLLKQFEKDVTGWVPMAAAGK